MSVRATAKNVKIPATKARLVVDLVRGKPVDEARAILASLPNKAARLTAKVLESAAANAANTHNLDPDRLFVSQAFVDEGMVMKRIQPKDRGRAFRILKRSSHITLYVDEAGGR